MQKPNENPCAKCKTRRLYASRFDIHFMGEDCPYICQEYEAWKKSMKEANNEQEKAEKELR